MKHILFWKKELFICLLLIIVLCALPLFLQLTPAPQLQTNHSLLIDQNGQAMKVAKEDGELLFTDIPPIIVETTLAVEDRTFFTHKGLDMRAIGRAFLANVRAGRKREGGSTITQQLAKNLYLSNEKTWSRKAKEAFYALRLEMAYEKEELFTAYLDSIYYGHGIYGVREASDFFFQKALDELSIAEVALLVGIPKGPTYYSPLNDEKRAIERMHIVLEQMVSEGIISKQEQVDALADPLVWQVADELTDQTLYYVDLVWREAEHVLQMSKPELEAIGVTIYTTFHPDVQLLMEAVVERELPKDSSLEVASVSLRPDDGALVALVGGRNYANSSFNRAFDARRMVGSTMKPFIYYAALENDFTAATMLRSEPFTLTMDGYIRYAPSNFGDYYADGPITLAQALAVSDNIYAVKAQAIIGVEAILDVLGRFDLNGIIDPTPALALGTASIPLTEMVNAYGMIANGGKQIEAHTIKRIENRNGDVIYERNVMQEQVFSEQKMTILMDLMQGMFDKRLSTYAQVTGRSLLPKISRTYAGKSGTTDYDYWMIGFTNELVTGVWIGYDIPEQLDQATHAHLAKNIWLAIMEGVPSEDVQIHVDETLEEHLIDIETGLLATDRCPRAVPLLFERGTAPTAVCAEHQVIVQDEPTTDSPSLVQRFFKWMKGLIK